MITIFGLKFSTAHQRHHHQPHYETKLNIKIISIQLLTELYAIVVEHLIVIDFINITKYGNVEKY